MWGSNSKPLGLSTTTRWFLTLIVNRLQASQSKSLHIPSYYGPRHEKTCLWGFAKNTGADQPAHPRSLISAFVIRFLKAPYLSLLQAKSQFSSLSL